MADTDAALEVRNPDTLVNEIERTRENLARTIDAIADRVSPASNARKVMDRVRDQISQIDVRYAAAGGVIVVGAVALIIWRRRK